MNTERYGWDQIPDAISELRQTVFIQEQQVPPELEWDDTDRIAIHYLVRDDAGTLRQPDSIRKRTAPEVLGAWPSAGISATRAWERRCCAR